MYHRKAKIDKMKEELENKCPAYLGVQEDQYFSNVMLQIFY